MTHDTLIASLLAGPAFTWNGGGGTPVLLSFSFAQDGLNAGTGTLLAPAGWAAFSAAQMAATREALAAWSLATGLRFAEVPDHPGGAGIDLRFRLEMLEPWYSNGRASLAPEGDIALNLRLFGGDSLAPGRLGYEALLHEIGHALGLQHSFDGPNPLPAALDSRDTSIMSYARGAGGIALAPRPLDIAAVQALYGAAEAAPAAEVAWDGALSRLRITGLAAGQTLRGTDLPDLLRGAGGDTLLGRGGDDWLHPDSDSLMLPGLADGGSGFDTLFIDLPAEGLGLRLTGPGQGRIGQLDFTGMEALRFLDGYLTLEAADPVADIARMARLATGQLPGPLLLGQLDAAANAARTVLTLPGQLLAGVDDQTFVEQLYQGALGRAPEPGGLAHWLAVLSGGGGRAAVLAGIAGSAEAQGYDSLPATGLWAADPTAATVQQLYHAILGRQAEPAGLSITMAALQAGATRAELAWNMLHSPEFATLQGSGGLLETLYHAALNRAPDPEGAALWSILLRQGLLDPAGLALAIADSDEYAMLHPTPDHPLALAF